MKKKRLVSVLLVWMQLMAMIAVAAPLSYAVTLNPAHPAVPLSYAENIIAEHTTEAPQIDGNIEDDFWKGSITNTLHVLEDNSDRGGDLFGVKWDNTYLYIAIISQFSGDLKESTSRMDAGDSMSFFFDPTAHQGDFDLKTGDIQLYLGYNPKADPKNKDFEEGAVCHLFFGAMEPFPKEAALIANTKSCMTKSSDGKHYVIEAAFRWEDLMISPQNNEYFAMNIFGNDVAWTTNNKEDVSFWNKTDNFGKITMVSRNISSLTPIQSKIDLPVNTDIALSDIKFNAGTSDNQIIVIPGDYYGMTVRADNQNVTIVNGKIHGAAKGKTTVMFALTNGIEATVQIEVINLALIHITPIAKQAAYATMPMSFTLSASNTLGNPMTYTAENLPLGATFDADTHVFSWTPGVDQTGDYTIHFNITDGEATAQADVEIHVGAKPAIAPKEIAAKTVQSGKPIAIFLSANTNTGLPLQCSLENVPEGAMFEADTLAFRWVPTDAQLGAHVLHFTWSDGLSECTQDVRVMVTSKTLDGIVFDAVADPQVTAGERVSFLLKATSSSGSALTYTVKEIPTAALFDMKTHTFTWQTTREDIGTHLFTVEVSDGIQKKECTVHIRVLSSSGIGSMGGSSSSGGYSGRPAYSGNSTSSGSSPTPNVTANVEMFPFKDMDDYLWAKDAVKTLYEKKIVFGTGKDSFSPEMSIKRADVVLILARATGLTGSAKTLFCDVDPNSYYASAVATFQSLGLVTGDAQHCFRPNDPITRQDMILICSRTLSYFGISMSDDPAVLTFEDAKDISGYANTAVTGFVAAGLITGDQQFLRPLAHTTRAEIAVLLYRIMNEYDAVISR